MSRSDILIKLFKSFKNKDEQLFQTAALEAIAEEQKKNHNLLAEDLKKILFNGSYNSFKDVPLKELNVLPRDSEKQFVLVDVRKPNKYFNEIILSEENKEIAKDVMKEYINKEVLYSYGIKPRTKLLFCGPPGCGKTMLAEVMSTELNIPILYTRFDAIVSSYLGETSANLRKVFDFASSDKWIIFFDEFDAIGKSRDDLTEHGELKRVINSFLQLLDGFKGESIIIAATNHEHQLDIALWRRFDEILQLGLPNLKDIIFLLERKLSCIKYSKLDLNSFATKLKGLSHASVERICYDAIRETVLSNAQEILPNVFTKAYKREFRRLEIVDKRLIKD